ncbi:MAG TPA: NYN domain-containing protein [Pyrinomonadaceae bacterium]|jgi:predicted RNA-binding protein with PIN domain
MPYLIDGNNVMAQRVGWHRDKGAARRRLLDEVALFAKGKRAKVLVVFDGAPEQFFRDGSSYKGVRVFYAERGSNADERIKQMVEASRERRTLIVVTSDRALASYVHRCGAQTLRSGEFRRRLDETAAENAQPKVEENQTIEDGEMKNWMRYFGVDEDE